MSTQDSSSSRCHSWERPDTVVLVLSTAPDTMLAKRLAHVLVEERLAACVHAGAPGVSMYLWQGGLEGGDEVPLTIKTASSRVEALMQRLAQLHPYDVPECLVIPALGGSSAYIDWVIEQTTPEGGD